MTTQDQLSMKRRRQRQLEGQLIALKNDQQVKAIINRNLASPQGSNLTKEDLMETFEMTDEQAQAVVLLDWSGLFPGETGMGEVVAEYKIVSLAVQTLESNLREENAPLIIPPPLPEASVPTSNPDPLQAAVEEPTKAPKNVDAPGGRELQAKVWKYFQTEVMGDELKCVSDIAARFPEYKRSQVNNALAALAKTELSPFKPGKKKLNRPEGATGVYRRDANLSAGESTFPLIIQDSVKGSMNEARTRSNYYDESEAITLNEAILRACNQWSTDQLNKYKPVPQPADPGERKFV
jgi:hypothetical protein